MKILNTVAKCIYNYKKPILTIMLILATISGTLLISYYTFFSDSVQKYKKNNYLFKVYRVNAVESDDNLFNKLQKNEYVDDVFKQSEYITSVEFENRSGFDLIGTIPSNINIIEGRTFDANNDDEIICPSNFNEEEEIRENKTVNISQYLNQDINLSDYYGNKIKVRLVGVFDATDGFYEPTICFASHKTIKRINNIKNESDIDNKYSGFYIQINNNDNLEKLKSQFSLSDFTHIISENDDIKNLVCGISLFIYIVSLFAAMEILKKILLDSKVHGNRKEKIVAILKLELKPVIIGIILGEIVAIFINYLVIPKIIPSVYLYYSSTAKIKFSYIVLNMLMISILVILCNLYIVFNRKVKENEKE